MVGRAAHLDAVGGSARRTRPRRGRGTAPAPRASAPSTRGRSSGACRRRARVARRGRASARSGSSTTPPSARSDDGARSDSVPARASAPRHEARREGRRPCPVRSWRAGGSPGRPRAARAAAVPNRRARVARGRADAARAAGRGRRTPARAASAAADASVAAEQLVGALAGERDRDVLGGELARARRNPSDDRSASGSSRCQTSSARSTPARRTRARAHGDRCRDASRRIARRRARCRLAGLAEADRERLDGLGHVPRHQRDDQARVETAAQHRAERHVAHQAQAHRLLEALEEPAASILDVTTPIGPAPDGGTPSTARSVTLRSPRRSASPGRSFRTGASGVSGAGTKPKREVGVDRVVVELGSTRPLASSALELGGEDEQIADVARSTAA